MGKGKPVILALLAVLGLFGQNVAVAQKAGKGPQNAANPSVGLGLASTPGLNSPVGLPAAAMNPPGQARSASSAGLAPPGLSSQPNGGSGPGQSVGNGTSAQMTAPGAAQSASSAGLTPPGQSNQPNRGASDDKSGEAKEKPASLTGTSTDSASVLEARLSQLPTCR